MPQIDFESLVPGCVGDPKVACEPENPPDFPPESFWLAEDAEFDWFDQNAFLDRNESTKGSLNPSINNNYPGSNNPSSQRFSTRLVAKSSILSLPVKKQHAGHADGLKKRRLKRNKTLLPKRNESVVRAIVEPPSPMVSCLGRVRSKRGRRKKTEQVATPDIRPTGDKSRRKDSRWIGLFQRIMRKFLKRRMIKSESSRSHEPELPMTKSSSMSRFAPVHSEPPVDGLGGMKRFASGRRSVASWSADDFDEVSWQT